MNRDVEALRMWMRIATFIAALAATSFPVIYSFSPWRSRPIGRVLMLQGITLAVALDLSVIFSFSRPSNIMILFWINGLILTGIAISTSSLTYLVWRLNHGRSDNMLLSGRVYEVMKQIAQVWLPALGTLLFAVGQMWHFPSVEEIVGTVMAVDAFLGVVLGISSNTYNNRPDKYSGTAEIFENEDGGHNLRMKGVDLEAFINKPEVTFKVVSSVPATRE